MTGKEALKELLDTLKHWQGRNTIFDKIHSKHILDELELLEKYKRAFEILKDTVEKSFDFNIFCRKVKKGNDFEKTYFIIFGEVWIKITKEEYELLEELINDESR